MKTARTISALVVIAITIILAASCGRRTTEYRVWQICGDTCDSVNYTLNLHRDTAARVAWFGSDGKLYRAERVAQ